MKECIAVKKIGYYSILISLGILFYFFLGQSGYIIEEDSETFLNADVFISRNYFIYVAFLKSCLHMFGEEMQLQAVFLLQSILALIVSIIITEYFRDQFDLNYLEATLIFIFTLLPYGYSLPESVATHHILTEGLSYSFFHLFLLFSIIVFLEKKLYMMIPAGIMVLLLMLTRSQLLLMSVIYIGLWIIIVLQKIYKKLNERNYTKFWIALGIMFIMICVLVPVTMIEIVESGKMPQFTSAVSGRVFCVAEKEDREYFSEEYKELYDVIYEEVDKQQQREPYFRTNLRRWQDIAHSTNENTKLVPIIIRDYCENTGSSLGNIEAVLSYMSSTLFKYHMIDYLRMTIVLSIQSLVFSIFVQPDKIYTICWILALLIYGCALGLVIYSKWKSCDVKYRIPIIITGIVLVGNSIITNIFFYGMQRYVVYCFGFFYISLFLLIKAMYKKCWHKGM